jgi:processive 1,2-diacylglycerol beta-glucosyltransferase
VGAGHNQAARAIDEGLCAAGGVSVERWDSLDFVPWFFRLYYAGGFNFLMSRAGWLYGLGYRMFDRPFGPRRSIAEKMRLTWERLCSRALQRRLVEAQPDLIINTHFLAAPIVGRLIQRGALKCPQMVVITDLHPHRWWYAQNVQRYFAPVPEAADVLRRWGAGDEQITISGIPIMTKWSRTIDTGKALNDWRLPADKPIALISAGAEFTAGPVVRIARELLRRCDCTVAVLAGRNKKLLARLSSLPHGGERLFPIAFTDRNHELVAACALMITKAGGITTAECLATGTPMLLLKPVPGQEGCNAEYLRRHGAAAVASSARDAINQAQALLGDRGALERLAQNARSLHRDGTAAIVAQARAAMGLQ